MACCFVLGLLLQLDLAREPACPSMRNSLVWSLGWEVLERSWSYSFVQRRGLDDCAGFSFFIFHLPFSPC